MRSAVDDHTENESMQDASIEVPEVPEGPEGPEAPEVPEAPEQVEPVSPEPPEPVVPDVAEATEQVPAAPAPAELAAPAPPSPTRGVSQTPFLLYLALWVVFVAASATLLFESARTTGALYSDLYEYAVYAAAALAALGPIVALVVWLVTRARRTKDERRGLFGASMLAGAGVTFVGSVLWLVLLFVLDLYHAGVFS